MPKQSGYWWVYETTTENRVPRIVWYDDKWDCVDVIGSHGSFRAQNYEFIRPCLFEHDTNREQCVRDCLGQ